MSVLIWLSLVSALCFRISTGEGGFKYGLIENKLENLEKRLSSLIDKSPVNQNMFNVKITTIQLSSMELLDKQNTTADSKILKQSSAENMTDNISAGISTLNNQSSLIDRLMKLETTADAILSKQISTENKINDNQSRLIDRLMKLEKSADSLKDRQSKLESTADSILSQQRSTENKINDISAGISTLNNQSRQILKNHDDLIITSCNMATISGVYKLKTPNINVYCESLGSSNRWLYIQKRDSGDNISFNRNWFEYKAGFGTIGSETSFWLGLEAIHQITNSADYELHIGFRNERDEFKTSRYALFKVSGESDGYQLTVGRYWDSAGNYLINNTQFSTFDTDNDSSSARNCAKEFQSGWWFTDCGASNLNGPFDKASNSLGIQWGVWAEAVKHSFMVIRRK